MFFKEKYQGVALVDDFRTSSWMEAIAYSELVYQTTKHFLQMLN
jgi:hypothetical protein